MDAWWMKHNMAAFVYQHRVNSPFYVFKEQCINVLDHHFGDYCKCGDFWCPYWIHADDPDKQSQFLYRNKETDTELYEQMKKIHDVYTTEKMLAKLYCRFDTNSNESFNKFVPKFVQKDSYLFSTIAGHAQVHVAASINSVEYKKYYRCVYKALGMVFDQTAQDLYKHMDQAIAKQQELENSAKAKQKKHMQKLSASNKW